MIYVPTQGCLIMVIMAGQTCNKSEVTQDLWRNQSCKYDHTDPIMAPQLMPSQDTVRRIFVACLADRFIDTR